MQLFRSTFDRSTFVQWARAVGAVRRLRDIHPQDFCLALVGCAIGDEERSIATARRLFFRLTGFMPEESSFYDRFNSGMLALMQRLFQRALDACPSQQLQALAKALGGSGVIDVLAVDASQVLLPASARDVLPSTDDGHGGFKLTATLSVLYQNVQRIAVTDARTHDRKALRLARWLKGQLFLFDRGYCDYRLFDTIARRGGFFVTRIKKTSTPIITAIRSGLGRAHVGGRLTRELPYRGMVDLDAEFRFKGGRRVLRVVRITVDHRQANGLPESIDIWLVTNLDEQSFSAAHVATLYRMRWEVETLFRALKTVGRLDQLRSASVPVIRIFIYATLIGLLLAQNICALMRRERPETEPSLQRVMALVLGSLRELMAAAHKRRPDAALFATFVAALWREGVNPNPGRGYTVNRYAIGMQEPA